MAFGIPNSDSGSSTGAFLGRIQYDARTGFWKTVKRVQGEDGSYGDDESEPFKVVSFLADFGSLEVGYIKLTSPPSFLVVPMGHPIPQQPEEMATGKPGDKPKKAFAPGFRLKVCSPKTFGDNEAYYFSGTAKNVMGPMDDLHMRYKAAPEAAEGKVPVISVTKTIKNEIKTPKGTNTFYAPAFEIVGWSDRVEAFGERTVPAPVNGRAVAEPVARHVPPPTPKAAEPARELEEAEMPF